VCSSDLYNLAKILTDLKRKIYICALGDSNLESKTKVGTLLTFQPVLPFLNVKIYALPGLPFYSFLFAKKIKEIVNIYNYKRVIVWGIGPWGFAGVLLKIILPKKVILANNYFTTSRHEWSRGVMALKISDYGFVPKIKYFFIYSTVVQYLAFLENILLKKTDVIVTNYKSTEDILKKEFGIRQNKFKRLDFFASAFKRGSGKIVSANKIKLPKKYLFFFSRHDPRKGVNYLLHSYKLIKDMGYKIPLLIAGGGDMLEQNKNLAHKLGIEKQVKFLGFVDNPKILMKKCTVFIFPSIEEGAGALTVNEAMEMGIPIVSTACDGIVEDITDGKEGLIVPMEDSEAMAMAIIHLIDNPNIAKKLARNAKKRYLSDFSYQKMKKDISKLVSSLESR
jgi:glycosyltransferase involved in cell wall biosynthesis